MRLLDRRILIIMIAVLVGLGSFVVTRSVVAGQAHEPLVTSQQDGTHVMLRENKATPDTVTVKVGETVQFNSADGKSHDISMGQGGHDHDHTGKYHSGKFGADEAWRVTFEKPGVYYFHDHFNPDITVLVVAYVPSME